MDPRERYQDPEESFRAAFQGLISGVWTALPVSIISYNAAAQTVNAQVTVLFQQRQSDGSIKLIQMKPLQDCPVFFPSGGGFTMTLPLAEGDEGLAVFADRCIDGWWQNGGVQPQAELRIHNLSDGFVMAGFRSKPKVLTDVSQDSLQIRSDDGTTLIDIAPNNVTTDAPQQVTLNTPIVRIPNGIISIGTPPYIITGGLNE